MPSSLLIRFLREPLVHFLAIGLAIFAAYGWMNAGPGRDEIVVTIGQQNNLVATFERTWQRPPTADEFRGLVQDFIRQEIAYREAGNMELDRDDIVIRRRLRQKLELLTEDLASLAPPSTEELDGWFAEHAEAYRTDPRYTFDQVYFSTDRRGRQARDDAEAMLQRIGDGDVPDDAGDVISLPRRMRDAPRYEVAATFGEDFAASLDRLPAGAWAGPVNSGFGVHLVRLSDRIESRIPARSEVEQEVLNDFMSERRGRAVDTLYESLAENYTITVEPIDAQAD